MADRKLTVIERMAVAHWTEHCSHLGSDEEMAPYSWWQESMLAAVRELRDYLGINSDFHAFRSIEEVITEHELRAGGKGE